MSDEMHLDAINALLPHTPTAPGDPSKDLSIRVENYITRVGAESLLLSELDNQEVHEAFCICCMDYLRRCMSVSAGLNDPSGASVFSITREEQLRKCVEFLVCLGIYPYLDDNVSLPLDLRLDLVQYYKCPKNPTDPHRYEKLLKVSKCLLQLRESQVEQLCHLLAPDMFLGDLVASLSQVAYGPLSLANPSSENPSIMATRNDARKLLWKLLCDLPGQMAMKELLVLQGGRSASVDKIKGAVRLPPAPRWLRQTCGRLLSRLLVRPTPTAPAGLGVKHLLLSSAALAPGIVSTSSSSGISTLDPRMQPALAHALAQILTTVPALTRPTGTRSDEDCDLRYHSTIAKQVLQLLGPIPTGVTINAASDALTRFGRLVAWTTVHELCRRNAHYACQLYLNPLVTASLRRLVILDASEVMQDDWEGHIPDSTDRCQLLDEEELTSVLKNGSELLSDASPSPVAVTQLCAYSQPIFNLLVQLHKDGAFTDDGTKVEAPAAISVLQLLSHLCISLDCRAARLRGLRCWLGLPETIGPKPPSTTIHLPSFTVHHCHPRLVFRRPAPISCVETPCTSKPFIDAPIIPYRCILTAESTFSEDPGQLSSRIEAVLQLLQTIQPSLPQTETRDEDCMQRIMLNTQKPVSDDTESTVQTLAADLFISLIADVNQCLDSVLLERMPNAIVLPGASPAPPSHGVGQSGLLSSLLAAALLDTVGDQLWPREPEQVVTLFEMTLTRLSTLMHQSSGANKELDDFANETISHILGILAFYAQQLNPSETDPSSIEIRDKFNRLLPRLNELDDVLEASGSSGAQRDLLRCIRVVLATRGAVHPSEVKSHESSSGPSINHPSQPPIETRCPLIEETDTSQSITEPTPLRSTNPVLQEALDQLTDPFIPVRGHALIVISRLLESRDPSCIELEDKLFQVLVHHLNDSDSYIYLNAIRALAALSQTFADRVMSTLLGRYRDICLQSNGESCIEFQLKLGEAIMRILRELGELAPKYRTQVLYTMTMGSRNGEPLVRAASLSNLAELCRLLRYAVSPIVYEIYSLIELHLSQDTATSVRQAAASLARSLLLGSPQGLPDWLEPGMLRDLHRLLSNRSKIERDANVLEQIEAALGEVDKCARTSLFPGPLTADQLIKQIRIMRP